MRLLPSLWSWLLFGEKGQSAFETLTEESFPGKWKIIFFYPKDFTFVCPTEIAEFARLSREFADRDAVVLGGSSDNEFCKLAWRRDHNRWPLLPGLSGFRHFGRCLSCSKQGRPYDGPAESLVRLGADLSQGPISEPPAPALAPASPSRRSNRFFLFETPLTQRTLLPRRA